MKRESISFQIEPKQTIVMVSSIGILLSSESFLFFVFGILLLTDWKWIVSFFEIPHSLLPAIYEAKLGSQRNTTQAEMIVLENSVEVGKKYSLLEGLDLDEKRNRLEGLMTREKLFLDEELRLPTLAEEMNLSLHCLSALLNEFIGKSFSEYVNEFRIEEAKKMLLEEGNRSVLSIGLAVGFNSYSAFLRSFKKSEEITPKKFRKNTTLTNQEILVIHSSP